MNSAALENYIKLLASLSEATLDPLCAAVTDDVHFRDPFHDTTGVASYRAIFADMLESCKNIDFAVAHRAWSAEDPSTAIIRWRLSATLTRLNGRAWSVEGTTEICFAADGRVCAHLDYWDAAGGLYHLFPVVGGVLRFLRRRIAVV